MKDRGLSTPYPFILFAIILLMLTPMLISSPVEPIYGGTGAGYSVTVIVTNHPFGTSGVEIDILTENGYTNYRKVSTAGGASWTFNVPPNQGDSFRICVDAGTLYFERCQTFIVNGNDMTVRMSAGGD